MTASGLSPRAGTRSTPIGIRRLINDSIRDTALGFNADRRELFNFLCECGDVQCRKYVSLTLAEYESSQPGTIVWSG